MFLRVFVIMASVSRHKESIRTMKIHLNANHDGVGRGELLSDMFSVHDGLKQVFITIAL